MIDSTDDNQSTKQIRLSVLCGRVFSPSAPIDKLALFAGRLAQIQKVTNAVSTRGRHCVLYGDRGVGKTSLANILRETLSDIPGLKIGKINCMKDDNFHSAWKKALASIPDIAEIPDGNPAPLEHTLADLMPDRDFKPSDVRTILQRASQEDFELLIVFDEFDRLREEERRYFSDAIKDLSDNSVSATIMLVGVANDVVELIRDHASIDRCLAQISMPLMGTDELKQIIERAMRGLDMTFEPDAAELVVALSQGLPHYAHLIGQESTLRAINDNSQAVRMAHVAAGITGAIENTQQSVRADYNAAAYGQRKGTLYPQVLLACALAETDELGYFSSSDVRGPLCEITTRDYDIPNFSQHLDKLSTDLSRGPVLQKGGAKRRFRFRFRNPLLRPFIIMKGLTDGGISGTVLTKLNIKKPDGLFQ